MFVLALARTSAAIVGRLSDELRRVLTRDKVARQFDALGSNRCS